MTTEAMMSGAVTLLRLLNRSKQPYRLFYRDFKKWFNPLEVPYTVTGKNQKGRPIIVEIDPEQGIQYLKNRFGFIKKDEIPNALKRELDRTSG